MMSTDIISGVVQAVVGCAIGIVVGAATSRRNGKAHHCLDHYQVVENVAEVRTDVKWIRERMEHNCADGDTPA